MMFDSMKELHQQCQHIGEQVEREFLTGHTNPFADSCRSSVNAFKDFPMTGLPGKQIRIGTSRWETPLLFRWLSGLSATWSASSMTIRIKRTTPFEKRCTFVMNLGDVLERCEEDAERGFYYGNDVVVNMISLCLFHAVYQESLWLGEEEE